MTALALGSARTTAICFSRLTTGSSFDRKTVAGMATFGRSSATDVRCSHSTTRRSDSGSLRLRSAGKALPHCEIKVADDDGNELPPGEIGEVCIHSPSNTRGYWKLPEATAKTIDGDGWLHTGDAGIMDEDGYVYIQDRIKDMIISGGENVYPAEVESAIYGHPAIAEGMLYLRLRDCVVCYDLRAK